MSADPPASTVTEPTARAVDGPPPRLLALRAKAVAWLRINGADAVVMATFAALCVLVRLLTLEGVSTGGDAIIKWHFVRQWFYRNDFSHGYWDHHMARMGVNSVVYIAQLLLGRGPNVYYAAPLSAAVLETLCVYACAKRLDGRWTGVAAALLLTFFPGQISAASQLMPEIFSGAYGILATYLYLRYASAEGRARWHWLAAASLAMFVAYLAKETSVFFLPGFIMAIWMTERRWKEVALFCGILLLGVACETASYRFFTDYPHRLAIIRGTHYIIESKDKATFWQLFDRYNERLDPPWRFAFYTFLVTFIGVLGFVPKAGARAVLWIVGSYYFFLTFLVRSINPIILWQAFWTRYLDPTAPFVAIVMALFLAACLGEGLKRNPDGRWARWAARARELSTPVAVAVSVVLGALTYAIERPDLDQGALKVNTELAAIADDTYERNLPFVAARDPRGVWTTYNVFIDDKLLARNGFLPLYDDVKQTRQKRTYLVKDPNAYGDETLNHLMSAHCYTEISTHGGGPITMKPMHKLDGACDAVLARERSR